MKSYHPGKTPIVVANADFAPDSIDDTPNVTVTSAAFASSFVAGADYFLNVALTNSDVEGIFIWSYFAATNPTVKAKYEFIGRALGFGCTEGYSCPAAW